MYISDRQFAEAWSEADLLVVHEADLAPDLRSAEDFRDRLHAPDLDRGTVIEVIVEIY